MSTNLFDAGMVYLVGAGPRDAGLITLRGLGLLQKADVIIYDALADPLLLDHARPDAECIDVGKRARRHTKTQQETNDLMVQKAKAGNLVVRLKGGDPYLFGRGAEELAYIAKHGIACQMVPGVTAGIAVPAMAGIPITHRAYSSMVAFATGHEDPAKQDTSVDYTALAHMAKAGATLCIYMGSVHLRSICNKLIEQGVPANTAAAVIQWGCTPRQKTVTATLESLADDVEQVGLGPPTIIVVGAVASIDDPGLDFFTSQPLFGRRVVITRSREQASSLRLKLNELGAQVLEAPVIRLLEPENWTEVDQVITGIEDFDWLILTSANGVAALEQRLDVLGKDSRHLSSVSIAAIGRTTASELRNRLGLRADLIPPDFVAESLAEQLIQQNQVKGKRFLLLRADIARPALPALLSDAGGTVSDLTAYRTVATESLPETVVEALEQHNIDWVSFASSSTVNSMIQCLGDKKDLLNQTKLASIGPITSATLRAQGFEPTIEADPHDIEGLIEAMIRHEVGQGS